MNFILNLLGTIFGKLFNKNTSKTESSTLSVQRTENTNSIANATAAILWICAIALAIYWIPQYSFATYFWMKSSIAHGNIVQFPLKTDRLFEMIGSLLGLGAVGVTHGLVKRLFK